MGHALVAAGIAEQKFAAPDRAIRPVARAIPNHAQRRTVDVVLGQHGGEVSVVVLDGDQ